MPSNSTRLVQIPASAIPGDSHIPPVHVQIPPQAAYSLLAPCLADNHYALEAKDNAAVTGLAPGMVLVKVNGTSVAGVEAAQVFREMQGVHCVTCDLEFAWDAAAALHRAQAEQLRRFQVECSRAAAATSELTAVRRELRKARQEHVARERILRRAVRQLSSTVSSLQREVQECRQEAERVQAESQRSLATKDSQLSMLRSLRAKMSAEPSSPAADWSSPAASPAAGSAAGLVRVGGSRNALTTASFRTSSRNVRSRTGSAQSLSLNTDFAGVDAGMLDSARSVEHKSSAADAGTPTIDSVEIVQLRAQLRHLRAQMTAQATQRESLAGTLCKADLLLTELADLVLTMDASDTTTRDRAAQSLRHVVARYCDMLGWEDVAADQLLSTSAAELATFGGARASISLAGAAQPGISECPTKAELIAAVLQLYMRRYQEKQALQVAAVEAEAKLQEALAELRYAHARFDKLQRSAIVVKQRMDAGRPGALPLDEDGAALVSRRGYSAASTPQPTPASLASPAATPSSPARASVAAAAAVAPSPVRPQPAACTPAPAPVGGVIGLPPSNASVEYHDSDTDSDASGETQATHLTGRSVVNYSWSATDPGPAVSAADMHRAKEALAAADVPWDCGMFAKRSTKDGKRWWTRWLNRTIRIQHELLLYYKHHDDTRAAGQLELDRMLSVQWDASKSGPPSIIISVIGKRLQLRSKDSENTAGLFKLLCAIKQTMAMRAVPLEGDEYADDSDATDA